MLLSVKIVMPVHRVQIRDGSGPMFTVVSNMGSANSVKGIATRLQAGLSGMRMPVGTRDFLFPKMPRQLWGSPSHLLIRVPCFVSAGTLVKLNAHFYLEPKLEMSGSLPLLLQYGFMTCRETNITIINSISLYNLRFNVYRHLLSTRLAPHVDWAVVPFL